MNWAMERATQPIADFYGLISQLNILQEECGELIQAASKYIRGYDPEAKLIIEEIADVEIMLAQVKYLLGPDTAHKVESEAALKIIRQKERIAKAAEVQTCCGDSCQIGGTKHDDQL